jgi:hypothetical protein
MLPSHEALCENTAIQVTDAKVINKDEWDKDTRRQKKSPLSKGFIITSKYFQLLKYQHCIPVSKETVFLLYGFFVGFHQQIIPCISCHHHHHW